MALLLTELRYAARVLGKAPLFTAAAVATLALGVGVNTAMFSVLHTELLRPLPFPSADHLVRVAERNDQLHLADFTASVLNYLSWKEKAACFEQIGAVGYTTLALTGIQDPEQLPGGTLTPSLLSLLGVRPVLGREFLPGEDLPGSARVAMIGETLWQRRFASVSSVIGQPLSLDGQTYTLIGVVPASASIVAPGDIFVPMLIDPPRENRLSHTITVVARLKQGEGVGEAQAQMDTVAAQVSQEHPETKDWCIRLFAFADWFVPKPLRLALFILMGAVVLVLGIACANIASLLLSRSVSRRQEAAVRVALGASRSDLFRQSLAESLLLAFCGGTAGVALAQLAICLLTTLMPPDLLPIPGVRIDLPVMLFSLGVTLVTALAFGLVPAWYTARSELGTILKQGGRASTAGQSRLHRLLVAAELAFATVLLIGAGLLLKTLLHLQETRLGFDSKDLFTFQLSPPATRYPNHAQSWALYERFLQAMRAQPGVVGVAVSSGVPFGGGAYTRTPIAPVGPSLLAPGQSVPIDWRTVSPDFLQVMKIPLRSGRFFTARDGVGAPAVTVISEQTAATFWGSGNPVGKSIRVVGSGKEFLVIGVVANVRNTTLTEAPVPAMYYSAAQRLWPSMDVVVRTRGNPESAVAMARLVLRDLDSALPLAAPKTMEQWTYGSMAQPRLNAVLVSLFAASALLIGVIGIYGVLSFSVSQRTREIGLRMALGARQSTVTALILREGMTVTLAGIGMGIAAAAALDKILSTILFEVDAHDPVSFVLASVVLAVSAAVACYVPARRAARVDPATTLRE